MGVSPHRPPLYRNARRVVILLALALTVIPMVLAQFARRETASKGPRALGLLELQPNGKAQLIPVMILYDGKFYDASAYKADPVPMALESGTVYEAVSSGISRGLFTVKGASQLKNSWMGEGTWQAEGSAPAKKTSAPSKPADVDVDKPPVLRHSGSEKPKPPEPTPAESKPQETKSQPPPDATTPAASTSAPPSASTEAPPPDESGRPVLRRGKPEPEPAPPAVKTAAPAASAPLPTSAKASSAATAVRVMPAISDANGPEPRGFVYDLKPDEEQQFRKKMLAITADEVRARARTLGSDSIETAPQSRGSRSKAAGKPAQPSFENVQLRVFDLSSNNEPVLVLSAEAHMPQASRATGQDIKYFVTLVARDDIYGELHKALSNVTDTQHLDVIPRMELIDAVDADGDGRGELLFRQFSDAGSAFVVYRVIGNQLWALFQGTPGQ